MQWFFLTNFPEQHNTDTKPSPGYNPNNFMKKHIPVGGLLLSHQIPGDKITHSGEESTGLLAQLFAQSDAKLSSKQGYVPQFHHL